MRRPLSPHRFKLDLNATCINNRSSEKKTEDSVFNPISERDQFVEDEDEDLSSKSSESETVTTLSEFSLEKYPRHFQTEREKPNRRVNEASSSVTKSGVNTRLDYSLNLIEATFNDIFVAIEVNSNYQPTDVVEEERSRKRVKDFTCRIGRMLYQTKQNYVTLKTAVTKAGFENKSAPHIDEKLAQLFVSSKSLLGSYLHFIPLSGGQMFPTIISDVLNIILDIGNLTASLGFSTRNLSGNVRKLEQIFSRQSDNKDSIGRDILNRLANTNNNPRKPKQIKSPKKKTVMKQSVIKPKPNKIFQARTNLARMRRMESINETDSERTVSQYKSSDLEKQQVSKTRSREREFSGSNLLTVAEKKCKTENLDMNVIKRRLHNLELLASTQDNIEKSKAVSQRTEKSLIEPTETADLKFLINRLEIMESDFDLMATKYNLNRSLPGFHAFEQIKKRSLDLDNIFPQSKTTSSLSDAKKRTGSYSREVVETIVNRITDEMISKDLKI